MLSTCAELLKLKRSWI